MPVPQVAAYRASCPGCQGDAQWQATVTNNGDYARTSITYRIDCEKCGDQPEDHRRRVPTPQPAAARLTWLRRTA